eukprot:c20128_g3_i1.p1 GENE.c20128_g3_i1~~c20128_g3_i1.p1  ORF type:complete len:200 (-),score=62.08 c20128_g3_i1:25-624(-)
MRFCLIVLISSFFSELVIAGPCWHCSNPYDVLGVDRGLEISQVKKAFRKQSLLWHPDKCQREDCQVKFMKLSRAMESIEQGKVYEDETIESDDPIYDFGFLDTLLQLFNSLPIDEEWKESLLPFAQWLAIVASLACLALFNIILRLRFLHVIMLSLFLIPLALRIVMPYFLWFIEEFLSINLTVLKNKVDSDTDLMWWL